MRVEKFQFQSFEQIESVSLGAFQSLHGPQGGAGLRSFDHIQPVEDEMDATVAPPPAPKMMPETLAQQLQDEAYAKGLAEGREAGLAEGRQDAEAQVAAAVTARDQAVQQSLSVIGTQLEQVFTAERSARQGSISETARLAMIMAKKVASHALENHATEAIEKHIVDTLTNLQGEPEIIIIVAQDMAAPLQEMLDRLVRDAGYRGTVIVETDAAMHLGDCRITWHQGKAERIVDQLLESIGQIVDRYVSAEEVAIAANASAPDMLAEPSPAEQSPPGGSAPSDPPSA